MKLPVDYTKLTPQERREVREEYRRVQGGICPHCKGSLCEPSKNAFRVNKRLFPVNFLSTRYTYTTATKQG